MPQPGPILVPQLWRSDQPLAPVSAAGLRDHQGDAPLLLLIRHTTPLEPVRFKQLRSCLSAEERQRLEAFRRPGDRDLFLLGRACLRQLLGLWLGCSPSALLLERGIHGKPFLAKGPQFNVSHSGDLILLGLHPSRSVGVDVERHRPDLAWEPLARRVLSDQEQEHLLLLPKGERSSAFLAAWCRLEARLKASGLGFAGLQALQTASLTQKAPGHSLWDVEVPAPYQATAALAAAI